MTHPTSHPTLLLVALTMVALAPGCATFRGSPASTPGSPEAPRPVPKEALRDSTVDISYVLGHSRRRLVTWARNDGFGGQMLMDHQILREKEIDQSHYSEFFGKAEGFVRTPRRKLAEDKCRTPFTVTIRIGSETQSLQGCRGSDDGALSHLVRDGEFLIYSNK